MRSFFQAKFEAKSVILIEFFPELLNLLFVLFLTTVFARDPNLLKFHKQSECSGSNRLVYSVLDNTHHRDGICSNFLGTGEGKKDGSARNRSNSGLSFSGSPLAVIFSGVNSATTCAEFLISPLIMFARKIFGNSGFDDLFCRGTCCTSSTDRKIFFRDTIEKEFTIEKELMTLRWVIFLELLFGARVLFALLSFLIFMFFSFRYFWSRRTRGVRETFVSREFRDFARRSFLLRAQNYPIQIVRTFFSTNFVIVSLSSFYSADSVGVWKFAGAIADSVKALIKSVVSYSGGALLASSATSQSKNRHSKLESHSSESPSSGGSSIFLHFASVVRSMLVIVLSFFSLIIFNYGFILRTLDSVLKIFGATILSHSHSVELLNVSFLFVILSLADQILVPYEELYTIKLAPWRLSIFTILKVLLLLPLSTIFYSGIIKILLMMILVSFLFCLVVAFDAQRRWGFKVGKLVRVKSIVLLAAISPGPLIAVLRIIFSSLWG